MTTRKPFQTSSRRGEIRMNLVALASLIMVALVIILLLSVGGRLGYIFSKNTGSQGAQRVADLSNLVFYLEGSSKGVGLNSSISIREEDLYLFYSAGNGPIFLQKNGGQLSDALIFSRPELEECDGQACICHCGAGPYWDDNGQSLDFFIRLGRPYTCPEQYLTCQASPDTGAVFGNSRGFGNSFYKSVQDETSKYKRINDLYYPIPFDVVLLGQTTQQKVGIVKGYSTLRQADTYVKQLTQDYYWDGGVGIGGTAKIEKKAANIVPVIGAVLVPKATAVVGTIRGAIKTSGGTTNNNALQLDPVQTIIHLEKSPRTDHVYGVCLHSACFIDSAGLTPLEFEQAIIQEISLYLPDLAEKQNKLVHELSSSCLSSSILSSDELAACNKQLSDFGLYYISGLRANLQHQPLYLLTFTFIDNGLYEITPQALLVESCATPEFIEVITEEPYRAYLPIAFSPESEFENFSIIDSIPVSNNDALSKRVFITDKTIEELCNEKDITTPSEPFIRSISSSFKPSIAINPNTNKPEDKILYFALDTSYSPSASGTSGTTTGP